MIKKDEKLSLLLKFFLAFLIGFLQFAKHRRFFCTSREIRSFLINFSFLDSALKLRSFHIIIQKSFGHPPHSSASPAELRLRVGPRALSGKKKEFR
jgi:hypothetical protein